MKRAILTAALLLALPFSASATIGVDSSGNTTAPVVYAKETLSKSSTIEKDGVTYYVVSESTRSGNTESFRNGEFVELDLWVPVPFARPASSTTVVTLELQGMVLGRDLTTVPTPTSYEQTQVRYNPSATTQVPRTGLSYLHLGGGRRGDNTFTFGITANSSTTILITDHLYLSLRQLGILPNTPGTIRVTFSYEFAGQQIEKTHTMRNAVKAMNLLQVSSAANNATVDVSGDGTKFQAGTNVRGDGLAVNVGKVKTGTSMTYTAPNQALLPGERVLAANGTRIISSLATILGSTASVEIEGETAFLGDDGKLYVSSSADCSPTANSLVGDDGITAPLSSFAGDGGYVCIEVDGETSIPETMPYTATVKHDSTTAAFPAPENERVLGRIGFGGSTVRIPFLTTHDSYNQRIVAVNRSGRPASYSMTFQPSEGTDTVATPEDAATGMFPAGRTILLVRDVVTLEDGDHTSATLSIVAPPDKVDVATVLTNRNDGSTDSVVYHTE